MARVICSVERTDVMRRRIALSVAIFSLTQDAYLLTCGTRRFAWCKCLRKACECINQLLTQIVINLSASANLVKQVSMARLNESIKLAFELLYLADFQLVEMALI